MRKKQLHLAILTILVAIFVLSFGAVAYAEMDDDMLYYRFTDDFLLEPSIFYTSIDGIGHTHSGARIYPYINYTVPELLERGTNPTNPDDVIQQYILSTYDDVIGTINPYTEDSDLTFAFISTYFEDWDNDVDASQIFKGYKGYPQVKASSPSTFGFKDANFDLAKISGLRFKEHDGKLYIYVYTTANHRFPMYLHINDGKLELSHEDKTLWSFEQEKNGSKNVKFRSSGYCLIVTENGLDIVKEKDAPNKGFVCLHRFHEKAQRSYIRYNAGDIARMAAFVQPEGTATTDSNDKNGREVLGWYTEGNVTPYITYSEYMGEVAFDKNKGAAEIIPAGGAYDYSIPLCKCLDVYPVYGGKIHCSVVLEDGTPVTGTIATYCPPTAKGTDDFVYDFAEEDKVMQESWVTFVMSKSGMNGGYRYDAISANFYTDDSFTTIDQSLGTREYHLWVESDGQTVLLSGMPDRDDVYIQIVAKKSTATVPFYGHAYSYVGPWYKTSAETALYDHYTAYAPERIRLSAEVAQIIAIDNPDWNGDYSYYWYSVINGETSYIESDLSELIYYEVPNVTEKTEAQFYCVIRKTNPNTKAYSEVKSDPCSLTIIPFDVEIMDACTTKPVTQDNIFIRVPEGLECYTGRSDSIPLTPSTGYTPDNNSSGSAEPVEGVYGFNYTITGNGTYGFRINSVYDGVIRNWKYITITYDNIIQEDTIHINFHDVYTEPCQSDRILVMAETYSSPEYLKRIQSCFVKYEDEDWTELSSLCYRFNGDNQFLSFGIRSFDNEPLGYEYTVQKNGKYQFKFITTSGSEIYSDILEYQNITDAGADAASVFSRGNVILIIVGSVIILVAAAFSFVFSKKTR